MTTRSSTPASSTPTRTRSANLPAVDFRLTSQGYNRLHAAPRQPAAQPVLLSVHLLEHGGSRRRLRRPRALARPRAVRDPRGPLRAESADGRPATPLARPPGGRARARRRRGRADAPRAREHREPLDRRSDATLARALDRSGSDRHVPRGDAVRLEDDDVVGRRAALDLAA